LTVAKLRTLNLKSQLQMDRNTIADLIIKLIQRDIDDKIRENNGKNRSLRIDGFNARVGAPMGSPYCASAAWSAIDDACRALGLKNPAQPTASSQSFRRTVFVPQKYMRYGKELAKKGDVGVFQVIGDSVRGHLVTVLEDQTEFSTFKTLEYNTDGSGSRDGDGAYQMSRKTEGQTGNKLFICFTDIPQWIADANP